MPNFRLSHKTTEGGQTVWLSHPDPLTGEEFRECAARAFAAALREDRRGRSDWERTLHAPWVSLLFADAVHRLKTDEGFADLSPDDALDLYGWTDLSRGPCWHPETNSLGARVRALLEETP